MSTLTSTLAHSSHFESTSHSSIVRRFMRWCESQQENRLLWLGLALTGQGAVLMPLTVAAVLLTGFRFDFLMVALAAIALAVVTNLAALPTKITIPAFLLGIVMDLVVLTSCIIDVFNR